MTDFSESDYGEEYYGDGFYSYFPVVVLAGTASFKFDTQSNMVVYGFRKFQAVATIPVNVTANLGAIYSFKSTVTIPIRIVSDEYIGPFWDPDIWYPDIPNDGIWVPDVTDGEIWTAIDTGTEIWVPDVPAETVWTAEAKNRGPWIPFGPDMRPNDG